MRGKNELPPKDKRWTVNWPMPDGTFLTFTQGDNVQILDPSGGKHHKRKGILTTLGTNGGVIRYPDGSGTAVKYVHLKNLSQKEADEI